MHLEAAFLQKTSWNVIRARSALDVPRLDKFCVNSSTASVILESSSISNERGSSHWVLDFAQVVGGRNTEEKYSLKSVALSFADLAVTRPTPSNVVSSCMASRWCRIVLR